MVIRIKFKIILKKLKKIFLEIKKVKYTNGNQN